MHPFRKNRVATLTSAGLCLFLAGVLIGAYCFSRDTMSAQEGLSPRAVPAVAVAANHMRNATATQEKAVAAPAGQTGNADPRVPIAMLIRAYSPPLGPDLLPTDNLMSLGFSAEEFKAIQTAFSEFRVALEDYEKKNSTLKTGPDGDYYEVMPFEFTGNEIEQLREKVTSVTGRGDWRADFLLEALKAGHQAGGLGKFRQEVAMEQHNIGGYVIQTIISNAYDASGKKMNETGYQVKSMSEVTRYRSLFVK